MKAVVVGALTGMGRSLARQLAAGGHQVFLLGHDETELARSAADLEVRHRDRARVGFAKLDLEQPEGFSSALDAADAALGGFDAVLITAALFATQAALEADESLTRRLLTVNFSHTVVLCEQVRKRLLARGGGWLTVFSSVAGDRGRKPVALYGASKAGLSTYLEALDHTYAAQGLAVLCVKPGFVKTGMTAGLKPPPFAGEPESVAAEVLRAMEARKPLLYTPWVWRPIMDTIRHPPRFVMRRINF